MTSSISMNLGQSNAPSVTLLRCWGCSTQVRHAEGPKLRCKLTEEIVWRTIAYTAASKGNASVVLVQSDFVKRAQGRCQVDARIAIQQ